MDPAPGPSPVAGPATGRAAARAGLVRRPRGWGWAVPQRLSAAQSGGASLRGATAGGDRLAAPAGLTAVRGPAVTVALDDAPANQMGLPSGITPDDLVRVVATSAVRCLGNTLVLQGRVYSPPFRITAIGDPTRMRRALAESPGVSTYRQYVDVVGLGYQVKDEKEATLPPYTGSLRLAGATTSTGSTP